MLAADALDAFASAPPARGTKVADRLRQHVLSVGHTVDPFEGYRAFRGHDADIGALMRERGFPVSHTPHDAAAPTPKQARDC